MIFRVENARTVEDVEGNITKVHMAWDTLSQLRWDLTGIIIQEASPALFPDEQHIATAALRSTFTYSIGS